MATVEELQQDLEEVNELLAKASRKRVCEILLSEQRKLETEISKRSHPQPPTVEPSEPQKPSAIVVPISSGYTVKINNYGWDQSDKFVKIYVTLNGVQNVPAENVEVRFAERSFELLVKNLDGKNYSLIINNLLRPISAEGSLRKIKTDRVLVMCKKKAEQKWEYLTQVEKQTKDKDKPSLNTEGVSEDPSDGLMNVLKKIYEGGDDEVRRSINKAWVESREKQGKGDLDF